MIMEGKHPITAAERGKYKDEFRAGNLKRVIVTQIWGTGVDFPKLEVLIRADGQASTIASTQIPGRVTRCSDGKAVGLVVDCSDGFYRTLEDRARKRKSAYASKGWSIEEWG
jgi:superfamily II DNA or RNA helicase